MNEMKEKLSNFILYNTPNGEVTLSVLLQDETIWLTQKMIADLFNTTPQNITLHLKNIYKESELDENSTCKEFLQVQIEGNRKVNRNTKFYSLDAIISVGYRINSNKATQFRIWATKTLNEFIKKGFVLDDNRLKQGEIHMSDLVGHYVNNQFFKYNQTQSI